MATDDGLSVDDLALDMETLLGDGDSVWDSLENVAFDNASFPEPAAPSLFSAFGDGAALGLGAPAPVPAAPAPVAPAPVPAAPEPAPGIKRPRAAAAAQPPREPSPPMPMPAPKPSRTTARAASKRASSQQRRKQARPKTQLPTAAVDYLKEWIMSPEHVTHPYPTETEKQAIMEITGITLKQLNNWFTNNRKRYWRPRVEAMNLDVTPHRGSGGSTTSTGSAGDVADAHDLAPRPAVAVLPVVGESEDDRSKRQRCIEPLSDTSAVFSPSSASEWSESEGTGYNSGVTGSPVQQQQPPPPQEFDAQALLQMQMDLGMGDLPGAGAGPAPVVADLPLMDPAPELLLPQPIVPPAQQPASAAGDAAAGGSAPAPPPAAPLPPTLPMETLEPAPVAIPDDKREAMRAHISSLLLSMSTPADEVAGLAARLEGSLALSAPSVPAYCDLGTLEARLRAMAPDEDAPPPAAPEDLSDGAAAGASAGPAAAVQLTDRPDMRDARQFSVEMPSFRESELGFTVYRIVVRCRGSHRVVERRYSDFDKLHGLLDGRGLLSSLAAQLPPKTWCCATITREFLQRRCATLGSFLSAALRQDGVPAHPAVREFLGLDEFEDTAISPEALLRRVDDAIARGVICEDEAGRVRAMAQSGDAIQLSCADQTLQVLEEAAML